MSEHLLQWQHLFKAREYTKKKLGNLNRLNMESQYRDEVYFTRKEQIRLLNILLDQQECGMSDIQNNYLTEDEQGMSVIFALSYEPPMRGLHV